MFTSRNRPENMTDLEFDIKFNELHRPPDRGTINSPGLALERAQARLAFYDHLLAEKRRQVAHDHSLLNTQWRQVYADGRNLKTMFKTYDQFVRANIHKRERIADIIAEQIALQGARQAQIDQIKVDMATLRAFRADLDAEIRTHAHYANYLADVVALAGKDFASVNAIMDTYANLTECRQMLGDKQEQKVRLLKELSRKLGEMEEKHAFKKLNLEETVGQQTRTKLLEVALNAKNAENVLTTLMETIAVRRSEFRLILQSINNSYKFMCRWRNEPVDDKATVEDKVVFIKRTLGVYQKIAKQLAKEDANSRGSK